MPFGYPSGSRTLPEWALATREATPIIAIEVERGLLEVATRRLTVQPHQPGPGAIGRQDVRPTQTRVERQVLDLQAVAGNRAVTALLDGSGASAYRQVQRYEAFEHATEGDKAPGARKVIINGVELSAGEINALGDLYGDVDELRTASAAELTALRDLVRKQQVDPSKVSEADWDKASGGRYNRLNLKNSPHFGPRNPAIITPAAGTPAGPDNRSVWEANHRRALVKARQALNVSDPIMRKVILDEAMTVNSFAEHFLMDAFSAGHLFSKQDLVSVSEANLAALKPAELKKLFHDVAAAAWPVGGKVISEFQGKKGWFWFQLNDPDRFQAVLEEVFKDPDGKDALNSAIVKAAHDTLSTQKTAGGDVGVEVENDFDKWFLSGDKTLSASPKTQAWIEKAIDVGRRNVEVASATILAMPDDDLVKKVQPFLPRPTAASTTAIGTLVKSMSTPSGGMVKGVAEVIGREARSLMDAIATKKKDKVRFKP
jgi:hypothetical protein